MTNKELMIEADMLQGNINRMMVTQDRKELQTMFEFAEKRLKIIQKERIEDLLRKEKK